MAKRRRLTDLFVVGRELTLEDGDNFETVWLQKLNSIEHAEALRHADARKARLLTIGKFPESTEYQALMADVLKIGSRDEKVTYLVTDQQLKAIPKREAEVGVEEEWVKDNYLNGLRDAWIDGLAARYNSDPTDPEAARVFAEIKRFDDQVQELLDEQIEDFKLDLERESEDEIDQRIIEFMLDLTANVEWVDEFYRCQIWLGVRESDNHKARYFASRAEVDELSTDAYLALRGAFEDLNVDVVEGKDSPAPLDSSGSSELSNVVAVSNSSGPAV